MGPWRVIYVNPADDPQNMRRTAPRLAPYRESNVLGSHGAFLPRY